MARYRKTGDGDDRVKSNSLSSVIESKINQQLPDYADIVRDAAPTVYEFLKSVGKENQKRIGDFLKKRKFPVKTIKDVFNALEDVDTFTFTPEDLTNVDTFISAIDNQLVGVGAGEEDGVSISVTKYGKPQVDAWVDKWLIDNAGMGLGALNQEQAKALRKAVKDYAARESVTEVKTDKKGRRVTTYRPGVSEAGIQETLKKTATELFPQEIERNKAFEFSNILSKALGTRDI